MPKTFHVTAPDGHTLEITGPDDATPEQAIAQAQQLYKPQTAPAAPSGPAPEERTAGQVAIDQAGNVGKGIVGAVTGIPGMVKEVGGIAGDALSGNASSTLSRLKALISGAVHSAVDPVATSIRGAAALAAPNSVTAPSSQDWQKAATDAGGNLGTLAIGEAVKSIPTSAEGIQGIANKLKAVKDNPNPSRLAGAGVGARAGYAVGGGPIGAAAGAAVGGIAGPTIVKAVASPVAAIAERVARLRAALDSAREVTPAEAPPSNPVAPTPEVAALAQKGTGPNVVSEPPPSNPIEPTPQVSALTRTGTGPSVATQAPPSNPIEPTPQVSALAQKGTGPNVVSEPPPSNPIEMPNPPEEVPSIKGPATSKEVLMAREALLQNGAPRSTPNLLKVSRIVPQLLDVAPELKSVPPGAAFDARLYNAFDRIGHELSATEASIPDTTMVPTGAAVKQLTALEQKYIDTNQPNAVRAIDKVKSFMADTPAMQWDDFIQAKRAFFNEMKLSSAPGREAYQIFKQLSNDVSPELGELNQKYYVMKSAIESAAMDVKTGERIRTIGKPAKPPIKPDASGGFVTPL